MSEDGKKYIFKYVEVIKFLWKLYATDSDIAKKHQRFPF